MKLKNIEESIKIFKEFKNGTKTLEDLQSAYEKLGRVGRRVFQSETGNSEEYMRSLFESSENSANTAAADANATANENLAASEQAVASGANASASALASDTAAKQANAAASREAAAANETYQASQRSAARTNAATSASSAQNVANNVLSQNQNTHMLAQSVPQADPNNFLQNNRLGKTIDNVSSAALGASALKRLGKSVDDVDDKTRKASQSANSLRKAITDGSDAAKTGSSTFDDFASTADKVVTNADLLQGIENDIKSSGSNTKSSFFDNLKAAAIGFGSTLKSFAPQIAVIVGLGAVFSLLRKRATAYQDSVESAQNAQSEYNSTLAELESISSQLDSTEDSIKQLDEATQGRRMTLEEQAQTQSLNKQKRSLETQKALLEYQTAEQAKESAMSAYDALSKKTKAYFEPYSTTPSSRSVLEEAQSQFEKIKQLDTDISNLEKSAKFKQSEGIDATATLNDIEKKQSELADLKSQISSNVTDIQELSSNLSAGVGESWFTPEMQNILTGSQGFLSSWNSFVNGLTGTESDLQSIESFFANAANGNALRDYVTQLVESGVDAGDALSALGYNLSDLNLNDISSLNQYFNDLSKSSRSASSASKNIKDLSSSISSIGEAIETDNAGKDYETFSGYLSSAKDWYSRGLTGTDEFEEVAKFLSKDNVSLKNSKANFKSNYDKISKYFTVDKEGNATKSGIQQFVKDLNSLGGKFKDTASAADAAGMSTAAFEMLLGRVSDYDLEREITVLNPKTIAKSAQAYNEAQSALENVKAVYDSMEEGATKNALGENIQKWEKNLSSASKDLSKLNLDIIAQMQFETNISDLMSQIEQGENKLALAGSNLSDQATAYQDIILNQGSLNSSLRQSTGLNKNGVQLPVQLQITDNAISELYSQLKNAKTDNERVEIYAKIKNLNDMQNELLTSFAKSKYGINIDENSTAEEINNALTKYLSSKSGQNLLIKLGFNFSGEDENSIRDFLSGLGFEDKQIDIIIQAINETDDGVDEAKKKLSELVDKTIHIETVYVDENGNEITEKDSINPKSGNEYHSETPVAPRKKTTTKTSRDDAFYNRGKEFVSEEWSNKDYRAATQYIQTIQGNLEQYQGVKIPVEIEEKNLDLANKLAELDPTIKAQLDIDDNLSPEEILQGIANGTIQLPADLEVNPQSIDSTEEQLQANPLALKTEINSDGVDWDGEEYLGNASIEDLSFLVEADADDAVQTVQDVKNSLEDIPTEKDTELNADGNMGDMALEVISSLTGIPTEVLTMLSASGNASSVVAAVLAQILGIPATKMTQILASGNAGQIAAAAFTALGLIPSSKNVNITASGNAEANAQNAEAAVQDVSTSHDTVLSASGNAISQARAAAAAIYAIPRSRSSVITVTRRNITINETRSKSVNGTAHYFGTAHSFGTAFADGSITKRNFLNKSNSIGSKISRDINKQFGISDQDNKRKNSGAAKASGDWSVKKDQTSLINEVGRNYFATLYGNM